MRSGGGRKDDEILLDKPTGAITTRTTHFHLQGKRELKLSFEHQQEQQHPNMKGCKQNMDYIRDDKHKPLSKESLEFSPVVSTTSSSAAAAAWRRPKSVTSIMRSNTAQAQEENSPSQSGSSCSQGRDHTIARAQHVRTNDDDNERQHRSSKNNHWLVTPDLATAWIQMASQDTNMDPKSSMTSKETTTTRAAPVSLPAARPFAMVPNELDGVDPLPNTTCRKKLARNQTGRSLLSSVTARIFRLVQRRVDDSDINENKTLTNSTGTIYGTPSTQDSHLNCPQSAQNKTITIGPPPHQSSYSDLASASSAEVHYHTASAAPSTTVTTSTSTSANSTSKQSRCRPRGDSCSKINKRPNYCSILKTKTTRMPPQSESDVEGITMSPALLPTTTAVSSESQSEATTPSSTSTTASTTSEMPKSILKEPKKTDWKAAVDPKSGRTYYYHCLTRETQWSMPISMASDEERAVMEEKERRQREFFAVMESNILKSISSGAFNNSNSKMDAAPVTAADTHTDTGDTERKSKSHPKEIVLTEALVSPSQVFPRPDGLERPIFARTDTESQRKCQSKSQAPKEIVLTQDHLGRPPQPLPRPAGLLVRTISTMDESVLRALVQRVPSYRNMGTNALPTDDLEISFAPKSNEGDTSGSIKNNGVHGKVGRSRSGNKANKLLSIQEALQNSWSQMETACQEMNQLSANDNDKQNGGKHMPTIGEKQRSMGTLLAGLPEGSNHNADGEDDIYNGEMAMPTGRYFYGASLLDESCSQLGLTEEEFEAMQSLAEMTDEIANVNDSDSDENVTKLNPAVEENDSRDYNNYNSMQGSISAFHFDLEDSEEDSQSASIHMGREQESGRDPLATILAALPQYDGSGASLSIFALENSSSLQSLTSLASVEATPAETHSATTCGTTPVSTRPRPATARPLSQRKVTVVEPSPGSKKPGLQRRNTCSTLYVGSTMSEPDKDATIKCICGVYRAHILQAEMEEDALDQAQAKYRIFNDLESQRKPKIAKKAYHPTVDFVVKSPPPLLDEITMFYRDVFGRAQMETDCIIMSLIYVERLIKCTNGGLRPRTCNWRSILFSCMVLSSKVWDDLSMWNADFSAVCPTGVEFTLQRINELEIAILSTLKYIVKVPASEYAKYYFLLRSMVIKSGLGGDDLKTMNPLDVEGAKRLQHMSSRYQSTAATKSGMKRGKMGQRSKSIGSSDKAKMQAAANAVSLEHVIEM